MLLENQKSLKLQTFLLKNRIGNLKDSYKFTDPGQWGYLPCIGDPSLLKEYLQQIELPGATLQAMAYSWPENIYFSDICLTKNKAGRTTAQKVECFQYLVFCTDRGRFPVFLDEEGCVRIGAGAFSDVGVDLHPKVDGELFPLNRWFFHILGHRIVDIGISGLTCIKQVEKPAFRGNIRYEESGKPTVSCIEFLFDNGYVLTCDPGCGWFDVTLSRLDGGCVTLCEDETDFWCPPYLDLMEYRQEGANAEIA